MLSLVGCNSKTTDRIAELEAKLQAQSESLLALQQGNDELQEKVNSLLQKNNELKSKLDDNDVEKEELNKQIELMDAQLWNLTGNEPTYTEEAPVYKLSENYELYKSFDRRKDSDLTFDVFYNYCKQKFGEQKSFYLLKPLYENEYEEPVVRRNYSVYVERDDKNQIINHMFVENIQIYSDVLGVGDFFYPDSCGASVSVSFKAMFVPVDSSLVSKDKTFGFSFGDNGEELEYVKWNKYVNIYVGVNCVGTCYYSEDAYMSERWLCYYLLDYITYVNKE